MGVPFSQEDFARTFGMTSREILSQHWPAKLTPAQVEQADRQKEATYRQIVRQAFPEMPGAHDLVRRLHEAGFRLAIASSGPQANIDAGLDGLGQRELFSALACGQDVPHGKPDPAVFLLAAERLGISPSHCAVIEDAPAGIAAANRAGMTAIAITGTASRAELAGAKLIVDKLAELSPEAIAALIASRCE